MSELLTIQIGDGIILNSDEGYGLIEPLVGLDIPPYRTTSFNLSGQDGGVIPKQFFGMRPISISGRIYGETGSLYASRRIALQTALATKQPIDFTIITYDGRSYVITARVIDFQADITRVKQVGLFKIELLAPDPLIYDLTDGSGFSATLVKAVGGGYVTPYILPVEWEEGGVPTNVINTGDATVYPTITFTGGTGTNPKVTNVDTGEFMQINLTVSPSDILIVDMKARTVTLNGGNIRALVEDGSTFWGLVTGGNLLRLETDGGSDDLEGLVEWRPGYLGI